MKDYNCLFIKKAFEHAGDALSIHKFDGTILHVNRAFCELVGMSKKDIIGKKCYEVVHHIDKFPHFCPMIKTREDLSPHTAEFSQNGRYFLVSVYPAILDNEEISAVIHIVKDITKIKIKEDEIRKYVYELKESNRLKDLFTDIINHDLLNQIGLALGYIEVLLIEEENTDKKEILENVQRNLDKAVEILDNATKFSKITRSSQDLIKENLDLKLIIDDVVDRFYDVAEKAGVKIENKITESMPLKANKIIEDVFINLISNALKYASDGRKVIVEGEDRGNFWRVKVIDFGMGVEDTYKETIFERFTRKKKRGVKGSGLGLAIAKKIIELHEGKIWVEDNPEGGAIFIVDIPKSD